MRLLSTRLIVSLIVGVTLVSLCTSYYQVLMLKRSLRKDLQHRAETLAESLARNVERDLQRDAQPTLERTVQHFANREHLIGLAIYNAEAQPIAVTASIQVLMATAPPVVALALKKNQGDDAFVKLGGGSVYIYAVPLHKEKESDLLGCLAILHDAGYIHDESVRIWRETFLSALAHVFLIVLITLLIVRWSITGPIARTANWMKALRTGRGSSARIKLPDMEMFRPLAREVATLAESLNTARSAAALEARLRETSESVWTADRLAVHVKSRLEGGRLFVVSNREPYSHVRRGKTIEVKQPPSGLVTALEPVLYACDGTWVAHGSGDADQEMVDRGDRLQVPPDDPHYTLRRVWLTKEEEDGYYYGFSNEGLWPLCHIAHTRPLFRPDDWLQYQRVNEKFAKVVVEELRGTESPVVLVQDYHFALLPRLIKEQRPDARIAIFWHIPWPNPEAFRICPWQRELLNGLLGADLIGFHVQAHCNNFLETVDRALEANTDWDRFAVSRQGHQTLVRPFPISVAYADPRHTGYLHGYRAATRRKILEELEINVRYLGVGVDRVDYTKGILERFWAIERMLDEHPYYQGEFSFVQIAAPSRTNIKRYSDFLVEVREEAQRINNKYKSAKSKPIILLERHHDHHEIERFYRAADLCLVTSLHDGMNLVAKEFVAARDDERGVLILSAFTGAARELSDALVVNPYDVEQLATAIYTALNMSADEQEKRMAAMRRIVRENNIYRWAGNLVTALSEIRIERAEKVEA